MHNFGILTSFLTQGLDIGNLGTQAPSEESSSTGENNFTDIPVDTVEISNDEKKAGDGRAPWQAEDPRYNDEILKLDSSSETYETEAIKVIPAETAEEIDAWLRKDPELALELDFLKKQIERAAPHDEREELYAELLNHLQRILKTYEGKTFNTYRKDSTNALKSLVSQLPMFALQVISLSELSGREVKDFLDLSLELVDRRIKSGQVEQEGNNTGLGTYAFFGDVAMLWSRYATGGLERESGEFNAGLINEAISLIKDLADKNLDFEPEDPLLGLVYKLRKNLSKGLIDESEYQKQKQTILDEFYTLEEFKAGTGEAFLEILAFHSSNSDFMETKFPLIRKAFHGLILNGEANPRRVARAFKFYGPDINEELIDNFLKLNRYSGFTYFSRFNYLDLGNQEKNQQENLERLMAHCVRCFEDPNYMPNAKIAVLVFPSAQDMEMFDAFAFTTGKYIQDLEARGYKIFPFEATIDAQIPKALDVVEQITGKSDLLVINGHGSSAPITVIRDGKKVVEKEADGKSINLGKPHMADEEFSPEDLRTKLKILISRFKRRIHGEEEIVDYDHNVPRGLGVDVADGLTKDQVALDVNDPEVMKAIGRHMKPDGLIANSSCGPANERDRAALIFAYLLQTGQMEKLASGEKIHFSQKFLDSLPGSLARGLAENANVRTIAAMLTITDMGFVFDEDNKVTGVEYERGSVDPRDPVTKIPAIEFPND